jgi:anti-anti-sigma regulatory factor
MLKIESESDGQTRVIRLIGRLQAEHVNDLKDRLEGRVLRTVLDLDEITLVDIEVVRFLSACEMEGVELIHSSPYVREWILREREEGKED